MLLGFAGIGFLRKAAGIQVTATFPGRERSQLPAHVGEVDDLGRCLFSSLPVHRVDK
jgi:hypothetical protein